MPEITSRELETEIEQEQHQAEGGNQLELTVSADQRNAGSMRAEYDAGEHEQRNRRQLIPAPQARQHSCGKQRGAERNECIRHREFVSIPAAMTGTTSSRSRLSRSSESAVSRAHESNPACAPGADAPRQLCP